MRDELAALAELLLVHEMFPCGAINTMSSHHSSASIFDSLSPSCTRTHPGRPSATCRPLHTMAAVASWLPLGFSLLFASRTSSLHMYRTELLAMGSSLGL